MAAVICIQAGKICSIMYCFLHAVIPQAFSSENKYRTCEGKRAGGSVSFLLLAIIQNHTAGHQFHTGGLGFPVLGTNNK